tara:strand:- start:29480 stop:29941 length:462 start_codon:yes stop_codon:yes gene_type:complete
MSSQFISEREYSSSFVPMNGLFVSAKLLEKKDDEYVETNFHSSCLDDVSTGLGYKNSKTGKQMKVQVVVIHSNLKSDCLVDEKTFHSFIDDCDSILAKSMRMVNRERLPYAVDDDSKRYDSQPVGFAQWKKVLLEKEWKAFSFDLQQLMPTGK